jgi:uncharacterized protein YndB with AHSA1/START domain
MDTVTQTDRIERSIVINAPRERVWLALSDAEKFGSWFGVNLQGHSFAPGKRVRALMEGVICGHEGVYFDVVVERLEPQSLFSYRWHPFAVDPAIDYSAETPTVVTFTLAPAPDNATLLTVVETGFDQVPPHRRLEAFRMNNGGWGKQLENVARYASA